MIENYSLCLNEFRKNLAANLDRSPLIHSNCYALAGDQSTFAYRDVAVRRPGGRATQGAVAEKAIFPLIFVPFMQHAG
jgi:hypothetical protein